MTGTPGRDVQEPARDGPTEGSNLGWTHVVAEIGGELIEPLERELLVLKAGELSDGLLGVAQAVATSPFGSPASSRLSSLVLPSSLRRSSAMVSIRRLR